MEVAKIIRLNMLARCIICGQSYWANRGVFIICTGVGDNVSSALAYTNYLACVKTITHTLCAAILFAKM